MDPNINLPLEMATRVSKISFTQAILFYSLAVSMLSLGAFFVFFLSEKEHIVKNYRGTNVTSAMICGVAAVSYFFITRLYDPGKPFPDALRYMDWTVTTPLLLLKFNEMLKVRGQSFITKLIVADLFMIFTGFIGELYGSTVGPRWVPEGATAAAQQSSINMHYLWGAISTLGYLYILYVLQVQGRALANEAPRHIRSGYVNMLRYVWIGWGIYPIVYLLKGLSGQGFYINMEIAQAASSLGDVVNKALFGVTTYLAVRAYSGDALYDADRHPVGRHDGDDQRMRREMEHEQVPGRVALHDIREVVVRPRDGGPTETHIDTTPAETRHAEEILHAREQDKYARWERAEREHEEELVRHESGNAQTYSSSDPRTSPRP